MMKKVVVLAVVLSSLLLGAFSGADDGLFHVPEGWPAPHYDLMKNPLTADKVALGRVLFYDPILSRDSTISCASCHLQYTAFAHVDHDLSHGIDNQIGTRNAPALVNLAWNESFMWDGAINHLDMQSLFPISHPKEMDENILHIIKKLEHTDTYPTLFYKAFDDGLTGENVLKAIAQFMLTLVSDNSHYDSVMRGQAEFTGQEKNGYALFKQHCAACHTEPLFTNRKFENNGLPQDTVLKDIGRMRVSLNRDDSMKFKVPTLRNIEFSHPYMHDGRFKRIADVLKHYTSGIEHNRTLSKQLELPITLSSNEKVDLTAFLLTLTDRNFLFDQRYSFPKKIFAPKPKD